MISGKAGTECWCEQLTERQRTNNTGAGEETVESKESDWDSKLIYKHRRKGMHQKQQLHRQSDSTASLFRLNTTRQYENKGGKILCSRERKKKTWELISQFSGMMHYWGDPEMFGTGDHKVMKHSLITQLDALLYLRRRRNKSHLCVISKSWWIIRYVPFSSWFKSSWKMISKKIVRLVS